MTNELIVMFVRIDRDRYKLEQILQKNIITDDDIFSLLRKNALYGFIKPKNKDIKDYWLKQIFNAPYLLCDQNVSDNVKKILPLLLEKIFIYNKEDLDNKYKNKYITKQEYLNSIEFLNQVFYNSSEDGKSIINTGFALGISDNVLKLKKSL